ncbi:MAG: DUF4296 domain-containing protein [Saprospiraceae bacterium]|nr:DUF4296 domain-containing protein [Saprospiraceae bacterium]
MRLHIFTGIVAIFFLSCSGKKEERPSQTDTKLARIMADLYVAEAATTGLAGYSKDSLLKVYYAQVFEMHGVDAATYEKDLRLISIDLEHLKKVVAEAQELMVEKPAN